MPCPTPIDKRHEIFVLAREGMRQGEITARVGVAQKNVNHILLRQAATANLETGKSTGAHWKTTAHQECTLFRMVCGDRFKGARALTERREICMECVLTIRQPTCVQQLPWSQDPEEAPVDCQSSPALPRLGMEVAELDCGCLVPRYLRRWGRFSAVPSRWLHESSSTAGSTLPARLPCCHSKVQAGGGSVHVWGAFHRGARSPLVLLDRNVKDVVYRDSLRDTFVPFARQHFGENFATKMTMRSTTKHTHRHTISMNCARPCWISGPISPWNTCNVWWQHVPQQLAAIIRVCGGNARY